jgi:hypothetical protein
LCWGCPWKAGLLFSSLRPGRPWQLMCMLFPLRGPNHGVRCGCKGCVVVGRCYNSGKGRAAACERQVGCCQCWCGCVHRLWGTECVQPLMAWAAPLNRGAAALISCCAPPLGPPGHATVVVGQCASLLTACGSPPVRPCALHERPSWPLHGSSPSMGRGIPST